jgi:hypothetical protein
MQRNNSEQEKSATETVVFAQGRGQKTAILRFFVSLISSHPSKNNPNSGRLRFYGSGSLRRTGPTHRNYSVETSTTIPCHCGNFAEARGSTISALADWHRLCGVSLSGIFMGTKLSVPALREEREAQWVGQRHNQLSFRGRSRRFVDRSALFDDQGRGSHCSPSRRRSNSPARATGSASTRFQPVRSTPISAIGRSRYAHAI